MSQQIIGVGAVANDGTGDTWRDALIKVNANETELFGLGISNRVVINTAADFPATVAGKIPTNPDTEYWIGSNTVSVSDEFTLADNVTFSGANGAALLTYTGTGNMFEGDGVGLLTIKNLALNAPTGKIFGITDTIQGTVINLLNYRIISCAGLGTVAGVLAFVMEFGTIVDMDQGVVLSGSISVISITKLFGFSTKATFKAIDLGSSVATTLEFTNMALSAPAGALGISGIASSGNVTTGNIGNVNNCEFGGGMTPLQNITTDDIRWNFKDNSANLKDTFQDALLSFRTNAAETVISAANTPVIVNATWVEQKASFFTTTAAGRATYNGERELTAPITVAAGLISAGGGAIDATLYIAIDGVVDAASGVKISISGSSAQTLSIPWQDDLSLNQFVEIFVENNTNTTNVIVEYATLRIR